MIFVERSWNTLEVSIPSGLCHIFESRTPFEGGFPDKIGPDVVPIGRQIRPRVTVDVFQDVFGEVKLDAQPINQTMKRILVRRTAPP